LCFYLLLLLFVFSITLRPPRSTLFPYTTLFRSMYARMNVWAAKALLAKIYLNAQVYTGEAQWANVIAQTDDIIQSGAFRLDSDYKNVFSPTNHESPEIIFSVPYDEVYGHGNQLHMKTLSPLSRLVYNMAAG